MIEVKITLGTRNKTMKYNYYKEIVVKGHANDGTIQSIKCCSAVTAMLLGFANCECGTENEVKLERGYFKFTNVAYYDHTMCICDLLVSQLDALYKVYPHLFKSFNVIVRKRGSKNDK